LPKTQVGTPKPFTVKAYSDLFLLFQLFYQKNKGQESKVDKKTKSQTLYCRGFAGCSVYATVNFTGFVFFSMFTWLCVAWRASNRELYWL
jgi:hypothetical protein